MLANYMSSIISSPEAIAVNRFGYGARSDELHQAKANPKNWIKSQLQPIIFSANFPRSSDIFHLHLKYRQAKKQQKKAMAASVMPIKNTVKMAYISMSADTVKQAITSSNSVSWRLLDFFSNHFSVSTSGGLMLGLAPTLEREAIAPNLLGNFDELLLAVAQHPAMLLYLNNERSFGENSRKSKKKKLGLNENLAREIIELHTLGVNGPYVQSDVIELAKAITGWSVVNIKKEPGAGFIFRAAGHEPGTRKLLGKSYPDKGVKQGEQMLRDLAMHPATVKYVCYKLAHHFVSQNPDSNLLTQMEHTWLKTHGNITQVMFTLFDHEQSWLTSPQKFKTPREFIISGLRALPQKKIKDRFLIHALFSLGQQPFKAGSPAGYSDEQKDWSGASALMARIDLSAKTAAYRKKTDTEKVMNLALGISISKHTYQSVMRAESRQQALTLLLMSPEFQRR